MQQCPICGEFNPDVLTVCLNCAARLDMQTSDLVSTSNRSDSLESVKKSSSSCKGWILQFFSGDDPTTTWGVLFDKPEIIVGRRDEAEDWYPDVDLSDILPREEVSKISRRHLQLTIQNGHPAIMDMGSTNGVYLNSKDNRLKTNQFYQLNINDVVVLGTVVAFRIKEWKPV